MEFGIDPDGISTIVAAWRRAGDELGSLDYPSNSAATGSRTFAALNSCHGTARSAVSPQATVVGRLADSLATFNATTVESDEAAGQALSAGRSS